MNRPTTPWCKGHVSRSIRDYGDRALLVECESTDDALAVTMQVHHAAIPGVVDVVPAARTVLVELAHPRLQAATRRQLIRLRVESSTSTASRDVDIVIEVEYDGDDLAEVATLTGLDVRAVIETHTATAWRVGFCGFAPGFAYLIDGDPRLNVPRKPEPRTCVPAGSVGLAGEFSGIYPRESPGGWQLIGHTDASMWDVHRSEPALLTPGMWVRFRAL